MADPTYPLDNNNGADLFGYPEQDYLEEEAQGQVDIPYDHPAALPRYQAMYRLMDLFWESLEGGNTWLCPGFDDDPDQQFCELLDEFDERDRWQKEVQCWKESQDDDSDDWDWWWRKQMAEQAALEKMLDRHKLQVLRRCHGRRFVQLQRRLMLPYTYSNRTRKRARRYGMQWLLEHVDGQIKQSRNRFGVGARKSRKWGSHGRRKSRRFYDHTPPMRVIVGSSYPSQEELFESYLDDESAVENAASQHEDDTDESRGEAREWKFGPPPQGKSAVMCRWSLDVASEQEDPFRFAAFDSQSERDERDPFGARLRMGRFSGSQDSQFALDPNDEDKDVSGPGLCRNISVVAASFEVDDVDATRDPRRFQGGHTLRNDSGGGYRNRYKSKPGVGVTGGAHRGPVGVRRAMRVSLPGAF